MRKVAAVVFVGAGLTLQGVGFLASQAGWLIECFGNRLTDFD
jgi:hypothetical protein